MSGPPPPSPGPGPPGRQRSGLRALSGSLSLSAAASAWAKAAPALRSELSHSHRQHPPAALAPFAMRPLDSAASLEMFKRMRGGPPAGGSAAERASPAKAHAPLPLSLGDSARHTETEGGTPTSQRSLLESVDEGWGPPLPPAAAAEQLPAQPAEDAGALGSGPAGQPSPFAAAAAASQPSAPSSGLVSPPSGMGSEALPPGLRADLLAQLSAMHAAAASGPAAPAPGPPAVQQQQEQLGEEQLGAAGGADTPHSAASWPSMLSGAASTLPQIEAELHGLDAAEVERLAADAAELQARAATALRLAQRRLLAAVPAAVRDGSLQAAALAPAVDGSPQAAVPAVASVQAPVPPASVDDPWFGATNDMSTPHSRAQARPVGPTAEAAAAAGQAPAVPSLPPAAHHLLQLYILLLALAEALLLWAAQAVRAASGGLLRVPRSLALAPLAPARAALPALLLTADACLVLLSALRGQRWTAAGL